MHAHTAVGFGRALHQVQLTQPAVQRVIEPLSDAIGAGQQLASGDVGVNEERLSDCEPTQGHRQVVGGQKIGAQWNRRRGNAIGQRGSGGLGCFGS
jgi:hypothetical protein